MEKNNKIKNISTQKTHAISKQIESKQKEDIANNIKVNLICFECNSYLSLLKAPD